VTVTFKHPPELSVADGLPPPVDLPRGQFWVTSTADGGYRIDRADPRILISAELIDGIADHPEPWAWLDTSGCTTYIGALLRLTGVNRKVIYRITGWIPRIRGFVGEWPD
jgi:hypothetical protein